jgi:predicted MFS family arabinose efflux permease
LRGRLYGLKFVVVFGAGMGIGTWLSGAISERHDLGMVFKVASGFTTAALMLAIAARFVKIAPRS